MVKVLHVLANGPPDVNGYAIRTQGLLKAYSAQNQIQVVGLTSPWYPDRETMSIPSEIDGITYHRCLHPARMESVSGFGMKWSASRGRDRIAGSAGFAAKPVWRRALHLAMKPFRLGWTWLEEKILFKHFIKRIIEVSRLEKAEIIHAHVPYRVGLPAYYASKKLGIPFVYEMRGLWEESAVASGRWKSNGIAYRRFRRMETKVLKLADAVICISETLEKEAVSRGISPNKITIVPNAVNINIDEVKIPELHDEIKKKIGESKVVGYIGSLRELEGVDSTAEAVSILKNQGVDVKLFVLSSKSGQSELIQYCKKLGLEDSAIIEGPVPHEQVAPFYDLIDVFVVSRPNTKVSRLVTPLKPFEAMGSGRALVMANLPALAEIIKDGETGVLYPADDVKSLAETLLDLLSNDQKRAALGRFAKEWIEANRTWLAVVEPVSEIYEDLML